LQNWDAVADMGVCPWLQTSQRVLVGPWTSSKAILFTSNINLQIPWDAIFVPLVHVKPQLRVSTQANSLLQMSRHQHSARIRSKSFHRGCIIRRIARHQPNRPWEAYRADGYDVQRCKRTRVTQACSQIRLILGLNQAFSSSAEADKPPG
jgi:hypothetical protein